MPACNRPPAQVAAGNRLQATGRRLFAATWADCHLLDPRPALASLAYTLLLTFPLPASCIPPSCCARSPTRPPTRCCTRSEHPPRLHEFLALYAYPPRLPALRLCSGYVAWVTAAFGPFWGFQEGLWSWLSGVTDNSLYPVMLAANLKIFFPELESGWPRMWVSKGAGAEGVVRGTCGKIGTLCYGRFGARGSRSWRAAGRACGLRMGKLVMDSGQHVEEWLLVSWQGEGQAGEGSAVVERVCKGVVGSVFGVREGALQWVEG